MGVSLVASRGFHLPLANEMHQHLHHFQECARRKQYSIKMLNEQETSNASSTLCERHWLLLLRLLLSRVRLCATP